MTQHWTLSQDLLPPVSFNGDLIYSVSGPKFPGYWDGLRNRYRYHEISLFSRSEGGWILYVTFNVSHNLEFGHKMAFPIGGLKNVSGLLREYAAQTFPKLIERNQVLGAAKLNDASSLIKRFVKLSEVLLMANPGCQINV